MARPAEIRTPNLSNPAKKFTPRGLSRALKTAALAGVITLIMLATPAAPKALASGEEPAPGHRTVRVYLDDLPVAFPIDPFLMGSTTMVPLRALSEALGFDVTWDESGTVTCDNGTTAISLTLGSRTVKVGGEDVTLPEPPSLSGDFTVVPLRFFSEAMGFEVVWEPETYTAWVKSPKSRVPVWGFYALGSPQYSSWEDLFGDKYPYPLEPGPSTPATHTAGAFLGWFAVDEKGNIVSDGRSSAFMRPDGWQAVMMRLNLTGSKAVAMFFSDNEGQKLSALLDDPTRRGRLARSIASRAQGFDGAAIDFEGLGFGSETAEKDAANFTAFISDLKVYMGNRPLTVVLHPLNSIYRGYDHRAIGELADSVVLMAYGYEDPGKPTPTAPWDRVEEAIRLELEHVPADKLVLGIPAYGTLYSVTPEGTTKVSLPAARDSMGDREKTYVPEFASDYSTWTEGDTVYHAYTESLRSLAARVSLAKRHGLAGVAVWRLGLLQEGWLDVVLSVAEPLR